ncbi:site-specific integrase [Phyllobacterium sp. LjRoot231]|uniref:tyrosine-type recombinase/integrase n=1 Tax=Phyllobacterium sp. LjRoot231 TaxID=3342289 RepID=UPI003ECF5192
MHADNAFAMFCFQNHMKEARGLSSKTIDAAMRHLWQFDRHCLSSDFRGVTKDQITSFKRKLNPAGGDTKKPELSASTIVHTLQNLAAFFSWLRNENGYRQIPADTPIYFTPPRELSAIAHASSEKYVPTVGTIKKLVFSMLAETFWQRRNRAVIAFLLVSGARDGAVVSLRVKHVDVAKKLVYQRASEVKTKRAKSMVTAWFPIDADLEQVVIDWIEDLKAHGANDDDPLFPKGPNRFAARKDTAFEAWSSANPIREIIREATKVSDGQYFKPHSVRSAIAQWMEQLPISAEEKKALSQNLGHEHYRTTATYYGKLDDPRKHALVAGIRDKIADPEDQELYELIRNAPPLKRAAAKVLLSG